VAVISEVGEIIQVVGKDVAALGQVINQPYILFGFAFIGVIQEMLDPGPLVLFYFRQSSAGAIERQNGAVSQLHEMIVARWFHRSVLFPCREVSSMRVIERCAKPVGLAHLIIPYSPSVRSK